MVPYRLGRWPVVLISKNDRFSVVARKSTLRSVGKLRDAGNSANYQLRYKYGDNDQVAQRTMSVPIPQPPTIPFIGNVTSVEKEVPLRSFRLLAKTYGEIFQLNMLGGYF